MTREHSGLRRALAPLSVPPFRWLFLGRLVSLAGSAFAPIALAFAVLEAGGSATDLGLVLAAGVVPTAVFFLFGGVLADRFSRSLVMVGSNLASAAAQAVTAVLILSGDVEIWQLALLNVVRGGASAFFLPAAQGLTPQTVPGERLQEANALLRLTFSGTLIVGAALGGILVAAVGPGWAIALDAVTYVAGALLILGVRVPSTRAADASSSMIHELREGWTEFSRHSWILACVAAATVANMAYAVGWAVLGPVVAQQDLGGAEAWGTLVAAMGVGFVLGGLVAFRLRPTRPLRLAVAVNAVGATGMFALALGLPVWAIAVAAAIAGAGLEVFGVFWDLSLQQHVPPDRLSRVSSYDGLGSVVAIPIGQALAGPIAAWLGTTTAIWLSAAALALSQLSCLLVPSVRHLQRTDRPAGDAAAAR